MATATLTWTLPTTRIDGASLPSTEIASVNVFDSAAPDPAIAIGTVSGPGTTFTTGVLTVGSHGFSVVVIDTTGHSSVASNVAVVVVNPTLANPSPVTDLAATLSP